MFGTHAVTSDDLLQVTNQTVLTFGEDRVAQAFAAELAVHNRLVEEMLRELCSVGAEQLDTYGGGGEIIAIELDEFSVADAQKPAPPSTNVGFPLGYHGVTLQWTRLYLMQATPAEMARTFQDARTADLKAIQRKIRRALYTPTNNLTYQDRRMRNKPTLPVRALLNADGGVIPIGPNGETFNGGTHTHYLATASLAAANVSALISTVREHGVDGELRLYINQANEAAIRAMPNFTPYTDRRLTQPNNIVTANGVALDTMNVNNRAIGLFDDAEVFVKPWVLANYPIALRANGTGEKPIRARTRTGTLTGLGAFDLRAEDEKYPLRASVMDREIGFGVHNRAAAAVLQTNNGTYTAPASF